MIDNPFTQKRIRAEVRLAGIEARQGYHRENDMPGTFVTGNSGVSRSRRRKLARQLDRTINLAVEYVQVHKQTQRLKRQEQAFAAGLIDRHGRRKKQPKPEKKRTRRQKSQMAFEERLFAGVFPCGIGYADRAVEENGDFKHLAFLSFRTLKLELRAGCQAEFCALIKKDAAVIQSRRGEQYQVSTSGQTVLLGG